VTKDKRIKRNSDLYKFAVSFCDLCVTEPACPIPSDTYVDIIIDNISMGESDKLRFKVLLNNEIDKSLSHSTHQF